MLINECEIYKLLVAWMFISIYISLTDKKTMLLNNLEFELKSNRAKRSIMFK